MAEVLFYQLVRRRLEETLGTMLERVISRGGRAVVRGGDPERLEALDRHLWVAAEEGFLPHGRGGDPYPEDQPVWLTPGEDKPNGAKILFLIDGAVAETAEIEGMDRVALLFEGREGPAVDRARSEWRRITGAGLTAVYWAETDTGSFAEKARSG